MSNAKIQSVEDEEAFWTGIRGLWSHHHSAANILHVFQKATEYQLQNVARSYLIYLFVLKSCQSFLQVDFTSNYFEFFDLKPQQRFAQNFNWIKFNLHQAHQLLVSSSCVVKCSCWVIWKFISVTRYKVMLKDFMNF